MNYSGTGVRLSISRRRLRSGVRDSGVVEGLVLVNAMQLLRLFFINDDESGLHQDYETFTIASS